LDQVSPEYSLVFGDLFSKVSFNLLVKFPTSENVLKAGIDRLADTTENVKKVNLQKSQYSYEKRK
jgi:hypothetical protein